MKAIEQSEIPVIGQVFNLRCECGIDGERVARDRLEAKQREAEGKAFAQKCQRTFEQCPGFIGCDTPIGPGQVGRVVVDPGLVREAMQFLKRRFRVNQNLELDAGSGLCLEVIARARSAGGGKRSARVSFQKPVQYELGLG